MPVLSVIIPTHKRAAILRQCLAHLARQSIAEQLEVIVVSDGHDPETAALFPMPGVTFLEIEKSQQGVARNRGVDAASGDLILFIGDDSFLQPHACEAHLAAHERVTPSSSKGDTCAVLGFTTWDPLLPPNRVMRWLEKSGWQFGYPRLESYRRALVPREMQHFFSYTSNISLPKQAALTHRFREDVSLYGWEDIEWGKRLADAGIGLCYEPTAVAFHHHPMTLEQSLARMEILGRSANVIARISGFDPRQTGWKLTAKRLIALLPTLRGKHERAFLHGMGRGID